VLNFWAEEIQTQNDIMTDEKFHQNWFQVRIFTKVQAPIRFADLLGRVMNPFAEQQPALRFFFSQYYCPLGMDDGDTEIHLLPPDFLLPDPQFGQCHASIRLRFRERKNERQQLAALLQAQPDFWYSDIRACTPQGVLPPDRFATDQQAVPRDRRIRLIAELLQANCRLVLNNLLFEAGVWKFQENQHNENQPLGSVVKSVEHMILNVWCQNNGMPFPIYGFNPGTIYRL
jgi:hypothetical protein